MLLDAAVVPAVAGVVLAAVESGVVFIRLQLPQRVGASKKSSQDHNSELGVINSN